MARIVKLSVLLEFELGTDFDDAELITRLKDYFHSAIRPEWKGLDPRGFLPGTFARHPQRTDIELGHNVFRPTPPPRKRK